jgi:glycosyltransferase involved in cell wall biosynthesis
MLLITQHGRWSASTRSRALRFLEEFQQDFSRVDLAIPAALPTRAPGRLRQIRYFASHGLKYFKQFRTIRRYSQSADVIFVQRGLYGMGPGWIARPVERSSARVVLDLDDNLFVETPAMRGKGFVARWLYGPQQVRRLVARADLIIVSTEELRSEVQWSDKPIEVIPTAPEIEKYPRSELSSTGPLQLVWAGTRGGLAYLDVLADTLRDLAQRGIAELTVISSEPWDGPSRFVQWEQSDEEARLASFDVGLMPLPDTPYARSKAGYKLLQYMATGMPIIASPVGINVSLVEQSQSGFLCSSATEWADAICSMYDNRAAARTRGQNGLEFVQRYANAAELGEKIRHAIQSQ